MPTYTDELRPIAGCQPGLYNLGVLPDFTSNDTTLEWFYKQIQICKRVLEGSSVAPTLSVSPSDEKFDTGSRYRACTSVNR